MTRIAQSYWQAELSRTAEGMNHEACFGVIPVITTKPHL